ncbi:S4 domain protein [Gleimia coleocanis DSM 15436]|uniref:S4 domain protein n=1 Tax=Gleimia coleocanis DSM 15436 TaxID=525245 RepID=C0VYA8_9ACTO|nr:RNA-binding S4 domain-containing protein [Gleimia coleocanis]EEH64411.1 S4 domain protein [Gleimia coleocanis DSM 15436]
MTEAVRVDTWLWSVRQVKSRSRATAACRAGHVKVNGVTVKPSQKLAVGDLVAYRFEGFDRVLEVTELIAKRVGAPLAQQCYVDHSAPRPKFHDVLALPVRERGSGRPTKRERRELDSLRGRDTNAFRLN